MAGWVRLYRKSIKSRVWANDGLWKTWCWCLMRANHNDTIVTVQTGRGTTEVEVKRGQFIYGRKAAAKALRCPEGTTRDRMEKLAKLKNIDMQPDTHYTLVTVCNFDRYNTLPTTNPTAKPTTNRQPTDNQPDTDKNVFKESKKKVRAAFRPPTVQEVSDYCRQRGNRVNAQKFVDHYEAAGWFRSRGVKLQDWKAAVRTWEDNEFSRPNGQPSPANSEAEAKAREIARAERAAKQAADEAAARANPPTKLPPLSKILKPKTEPQS